MVFFWHTELRQPVYQVYFGLLIGLPNAVTSFNRWSKLAEAVVRRLLMCLFSMYYDDATLQDWGSSGHHCQDLVEFLSVHGKTPAYLLQQAQHLL